MLPALSESRNLRYTTVSALYFAQGIQYGLITIALPGYLAFKGASPVVIASLIGAIIIPWTLKLLYAPLMERYSFLPMGRRRPWVIAGTLGGALGYVLMASVPEPVNQMPLFISMAVIGSTFLALMDVSVDALTIDVVPFEEQPRANSLMWGSKVIGVAATGAGGSWLLNLAGMQISLLVIGLITALFALFPLLLREHPGERLLPWTSGQPSAAAMKAQLSNWQSIGRSLKRVLRLSDSLYISLGLFLFGLTAGMFDAYMPLITVQDLGWTDTSFSNLMAGAGLAAGLIGMVLAGYLMKWFGRVHTIILTAGIMAVAGLFLAFFYHSIASTFLVQSFVIISLTLRCLAMISFFAACMAMCYKPVSAAQFALYMAIGNLGISLGAAAIGPLTALLTYPQILILYASISTAALLLVRWVKISKHVIRVKSLYQPV